MPMVMLCVICGSVYMQRLLLALEGIQGLYKSAGLCSDPVTLLHV